MLGPPAFGISLVTFVMSGACAAYQMAVSATFVARVPAGWRGLANGGMQIVLGLWFLAAGAIAEA